MSQNPINLTTPGLGPGDKLDKFEVVEQIGAGGMSVVWKGYDRLLDRYVAIKQLTPMGGLDDDDEFRERFRQEAKIQKRLAAGSKNLVRVVEFVEEQRGLFIVMEYVDGPSLEELLEQSDQPMEQRQALGIIGATALALESIHAQGVIHRDLKPSNILLPRVGGLKVCDFGLSMLTADGEAPSAGSVRYMAPELFRNDQVGPRADIYALGIIAYEMLAGRSRFNEAFKVVLRDQRNQALRWMKWHTNMRVTAPPLAQTNPEVPQTLSDLVARMMEKDPAQRVPSATDLLGAIRRHFAGGPAMNEPIIPKAEDPHSAALAAASSEKTAPLPKKSRLPYILAGVLVLQVFIGLGVWAYMDISKKAAAKAQVFAAAEARFDEAGKYASEAKQLFDQSRQKFDELKLTKSDRLFADAKAIYDELSAKWPKHAKFGDFSKTLSIYCAGMRAYIAKEYVPAQRLLQQAYERGLTELKSANGRIEQVTLAASHAQMFGMVENALGVLRPKYDSWLKQALDLKQRLVSVNHSAMDNPQWADWVSQYEADVQTLRHELATASDQPARDSLETALNSLGELVRAKATNDERLTKELEAALDKSLERAQLQVGELESKPNFNAARWYLTRFRDSAGQTLLTDEQRYADALGTIIEDKERRSVIDNIVAEANALVERGQREQAIAGLRAAAEKYPDREVRELLSKLELTFEHDRALAAGNQAEASGDLATAITSYESALRIKPDAELEDRVKQLKGRDAFQKGLALEQGGNVEAASAQYRRALEFFENEQAREGLARIQNLDKRTSYVQAGDRAFEAGNFATALAQYGKAQQINTTQDVTQKIAAATINLELQKAQSALSEGKLDDVAAAIAKVNELDPGNKTAEALTQHVGHVKEYVKHRDKGDEFRKASDFGAATREYRLARAVFDPPPAEIVARINDTEYDSWMAQARNDMKNKDFKAAYPKLLTAMRIKETNEVKQLLAEIQPNANDKKPGP
jgi:tetratricopeptide (TPR) repeat protein/predicted Ser/Thr protein kinase